MMTPPLVMLRAVAAPMMEVEAYGEEAQRTKKCGHSRRYKPTHDKACADRYKSAHPFGEVVTCGSEASNGYGGDKTRPSWRWREAPRHALACGVSEKIPVGGKNISRDELAFNFNGRQASFFLEGF
jgi:hypothetical protein